MYTLTKWDKSVDTFNDDRRAKDMLFLCGYNLTSLDMHIKQLKEGTKLSVAAGWLSYYEPDAFESNPWDAVPEED